MLLRPRPSSIFTRRSILLKEAPSAQSSNAPETSAPEEREFKVLVINASQEMAKEITLQLTLSFPGCAITYAPTVELAKWILSRRRVDLVVSSPILPDGNITKLSSVLNKLSEPPDIVVVGDAKSSSPKILGDSNYEVAGFRKLGAPAVPTTTGSLRIGAAPKSPVPTPKIEQIRTLGANLRNDLNNPLQEIVAMVFVAKAAGPHAGESTQQALEAIDKAAHNMANIVRGLEDKIRDAISPTGRT